MRKAMQGDLAYKVCGILQVLIGRFETFDNALTPPPGKLEIKHLRWDLQEGPDPFQGSHTDSS